MQEKSVDKVDTVDKSGETGPVIVGFGTRPQEAALRTAGADRVFIHPDQTASLFEVKGAALRSGDTLLMAQPGLLKVDEYRELYEASGGGLKFQVIGREPLSIRTRTHFQEFRQIKAVGAVALVQLRGAPRRIDPTIAQSDAIINLWHEKPKLSRPEIVQKAKEILGLDEDFDMRLSWPRDLVIKWCGTGQRDRPEGWTGIKKIEDE